MERFEVRNRFSGAAQFTAEIECASETPPSVKLGLAVRWAVKARADLAGADLTNTCLVRADFAGADLAGACLVRADLAGAEIKSVLAIITRIHGGYTFHAYDTDKGVRVIAGCHNMTTAEYREHVAREYPGTAKAAETLAILDYIDARAVALRKLLEAKDAGVRAALP